MAKRSMGDRLQGLGAWWGGNGPAYEVAKAERMKAEEARRANHPTDQLEDLQRIDKADTLRAQGNKAYQAKQFQEALDSYEQALTYNPKDLSVYTNMAAVQLEKKEPEKALDLCDRAIQVYEEGGMTGEFKKIARAYARKGAAFK